MTKDNNHKEPPAIFVRLPTLTMSDYISDLGSPVGSSTTYGETN